MIALLLAASMPADQTTPAAARVVVRCYYDAIEHRRYRAAYRLWSDRGRASGRSYPAFVRGYARTAHVRVVAGQPTAGEGAAGSVFITVPVTVTAVLKDGTRQRFRGGYVLRRVNGVDGASAEQLRWHLASAHLRAS